MAKYTAQDKQASFHFAESDEVFYGGSAGGGKSYAIIWDAVSFCMQNENVSAAIFRRTYPELEKSIILEGLRSIPATWYQYNKKEHRMYFKNGSILEFNYCLYENDVYNFQSAQYDRLYFDELTHFTKSIYLYLTSRCRTTKPNIKPQIKSASNPGNIGHEWVKQRFIARTDWTAIPNKEMIQKDIVSGAEFTSMYIPARVYDNKYLMEGDSKYVNRLMKLDKDDRRMLLDGDWDILKGQFFAEWRYDTHVIEPFPIPTWWTRIRCIDWGWTAAAVCLWIAFSPEGKAYVYRELKVTETTDKEFVKQILNLSKLKVGENLKNENISYTMVDPALFSISQYERGESIAYRMIRNGLPIVKADNNRIAGWTVIREYLEHNENQKPKLQVFNTVSYLIETLPGLIHDDRDPEDLNTKGEDHAADALRYGLMSKPIIPNKPKSFAPQDSFKAHFKRKEAERGRAGYVGSY